MTTVTITTGARLHFGPLSVDSPFGGKFGGVGLMIESPRVVLSARIAESDSVRADEITVRRIEDFLRRVRNAVTSTPLPACEINVSQTIPSHCGFGSGTQLALAVAQATSCLGRESQQSMETLARRVGRGLRSAIGLHGFERGGFLVDGGRKNSDQLGTLVSRVEFPSDWQFVLAAPRNSMGLSGEEEQTTFASQPPMPSSVTAELCRIVLMEWLPSVIEADFTRCSESLFSFGQKVGEFFSRAQGGIFAHPRMAKWASVIRDRGVHGLAQTSWGPTVAALCASDAAARQLHRDFATDSDWNDCSFKIVAPLNRGATVSVE